MPRVFSGFSVAALALVAGCTSTGTAIETDQGGRFVPNARVSIAILKKDSPSDPQDGTAVELGVAGVRGRSTQTLSSGQRVEIGDQNFSGPVTLENEARATIVDGVFRWRRFTDSRVLGIELLGGLGYVNADFASTAGTQRGSEGFNSLGLVGGIGGIWRIGPSTSVQGRYSLFFTGGWFEESDVQRIDLALVQSLGRNFSVRAGYQAWAIESKHVGRSEISARLRGPSLGFELSF